MAAVRLARRAGRPGNAARWRMGAAALALAVALLGTALDDVRAHGDLPRDSASARAYMAAKVRNDPAGMWATYSEHARQARGGDRAAYVAMMLRGTHPHSGPANPVHLQAAVPLDSGLTLLYYRVDLLATGGREHVTIPVVTDAAGRVEDAGFDGLSFVAPTGPAPAPFSPTYYPDAEQPGVGAGV